MKINEMEERLQISRANIRFYEKEGLLCPIRKANGYREYSEEDFARLQKIIIFRKLGMSITDIRELIRTQEKSRQQFTDMMKDYLVLEERAFITMWKYFFFWNVDDVVKVVAVLACGFAMIFGIPALAEGILVANVK